MHIGAIADDLTGATDLALTLARQGMKVLQVVGVPGQQTRFDGAEAVVVALKSRTIPPAEAVAQSLACARALLAAGARQLFFKYCSTFDSTPDGNIGPVIDALLDLTGQSRTIVCPAFPANGRTLYKGHLFVGDTLLSESSMRNHPLTPMTDANLVRVLGAQCTRPVSLISHEIVSRGAEAIAGALEALDGVAIVDALNETDLVAIGRAAASLKLVTGGSGVALGLPANFGAAPKQRAEPMAAPEGRGIILAGSCSAATRRQVEHAVAAGTPAMRIDPLAISQGSISIEDAVRFAGSAGNRTALIYSSADPAMVAATQAELGRQVAGETIERFMGEVARRLRAQGYSRFLVAGGETSGAVVQALGVSALEIGPEIDPGVPWTLSHGDNPVALALKSGNFGTDDFFTKAWNLLS